MLRRLCFFDWGWSVRLSVCLPVNNITRKILTDFDENFHDSSAMIQGTFSLNFGSDPGQCQINVCVLFKI